MTETKTPRRVPSIFEADKIIHSLLGAPREWVTTTTHSPLYFQPLQIAPMQSLVTLPQQQMIWQPVEQPFQQQMVWRPVEQQPIQHQMVWQPIQHQMVWQPFEQSDATTWSVPLCQQQTYQPLRRHHIFIDYSNLLASARRSSGTYDKQARMSCRNVINLIERGRSCVPTRVIAGSIDEGDDWQKEWKDAMFTVHQNKRAADGKEIGVDDLLIGLAQGLLVDEVDNSKCQTLVLVTGDGNDNDGRDSFVKLAQRVLKVGWDLEIWAWKKSCSQVYLRLGKNQS